ncbi:hypothetical protein ACA910_009421 [Epithemia clementina (nom. ined.)]
MCVANVTSTKIASSLEQEETLSVTNPQTEDGEDAQSVNSSNVNNEDHEEAQEQMMIFVGDDDDENESDDNYVRDEEIIPAAARHVTSAREMRCSIKDRQETSQQLKANNVEHSDMCYMIIIDYAQNMDVPHFGGEQPCETYYYSPKNVFVFGVCDVTVNPIQMHAYCYEEETGKKGGNNVALLIMLHLERQGILKKKEGTNEPMTGNKLTIACDNCAGQNKNNMVVRLASYLVEKGHFQEVEFLFYVKGHTKNACDRSFNLMKMRFRKNNIYTYKDGDKETSLFKVTGTADKVHPVDVSHTDFRDWDSLLNKLYKKLVPNTLSSNHSFKVQKIEGPTILL